MAAATLDRALAFAHGRLLEDAALLVLKRELVMRPPRPGDGYR